MQAGLAREATAEENSGEHGSDAADVGQNVCLRVAEIGVSRLSEVGLIAEADDDDQGGIEEDVCTGAAGETTGGVEGKGGDENEGDAAGAEVEGCPLNLWIAKSTPAKMATRLRGTRSGKGMRMRVAPV